ncbi:hypothetical protein IJ750_04490 [bacterium]|nr:hypothetical protein [bacterium]
MRDLIKLLLVGVVIAFAPLAFCEEQYKVVILPDNIVTDGAAIDSYIYNQTAEFFAGEVINLLNQTDKIKCPTVADERKLLKSDPAAMIPARNLTNKFKTTYNIDYPLLKKVANKSQSKYVLMLTSSIDSENYVLRRTVWDFLNIAGATVIDPAYKISTYAALVDTSKNTVLWSNTFYKTISVVEARIIPQGPSPQTEQLQKIRDYSRMICPEIAEHVQLSILPPGVYEKETHKIYYDMGNFDNVFTKKYRRWGKEGKKDYEAFKNKIDSKATKIKQNNQQRREQKQVKAEQYVNPNVEIKDSPTKIIQPLDFEDQTLFDPVYIKRHKKNNLYGEFDPSRPPLRDYDRL